MFVVHRIDLETSGLVVFAKNDHANRELSRRFRDHDLERAYLAVVAGAFPEELKAIDRPVGGRRALTHVEIRERFDDRAKENWIESRKAKVEPPANPAQVKLFLMFYYIMTGLHAVHLTVGIGWMTVLVVLAARGRFSPMHYMPIEIAGLYWHFVDVVWIFLLPLLYLTGTHQLEELRHFFPTVKINKFKRRKPQNQKAHLSGIQNNSLVSRFADSPR